MATTATIRLHGLSWHFRAIEQLSTQAHRRMIPKAVRAGAKPGVKATRDMAPVVNRLLRRSIGLVIRRYRGSVYAVFGQERGKEFKPGKRKPNKAGGISGRNMAAPIHLVDQPVAAHEIRKKGPWLRLRIGGQSIYRARMRHPGHRGRRFMAAAAASSRAESTKQFETKFMQELEAETAKLAGSAPGGTS